MPWPLRWLGVGVFGDEVIALDERIAAEVRRAAERAAVCVRDAGIEHGDDHAFAARRPVGGDVGPRFGGVHAEFPREVPLQFLPAPRMMAGAFVVWDQPAGLAGDARAIVGHRPRDAALCAQAAQAGGDADAGGEVQHARADARRARFAGCGAGEPRRAGGWVGRRAGRLAAHNHLVGYVRGGGGRGPPRGPAQRGRRAGAEQECGGTQREQDRGPLRWVARGWAGGGEEHGVWVMMMCRRCGGGGTVADIAGER